MSDPETDDVRDRLTDAATDFYGSLDDELEDGGGCMELAEALAAHRDE